MASYKILSSREEDKLPRIKITVELGYDARGKRIRRHKTVTVNSLSERVIQKAITAFELDVSNDKPTEYNDITYQDATNLWLKNHVSGLAEKSRRAYEWNIAESVRFFGNIKVKNMKKINFVEFKNHLIDNDIKVAKGIFDTSKAVLTKMVEWEMIDRNPSQGITMNKSKSKMDFYNKKEINQLFEVLNECDAKHRLIIKLAILSGMRRAEIAGLTIENVDFKNNRIHVKHNLNYSKKDGYYLGPTKNKKERTLVMPPVFMMELKAFVFEVRKNKLALGDKNRTLPGMNLVFANYNGYPNEESHISKTFLKILDLHNLRRIRFHDLRHSHASLLLSLGEKMKVIQERLGHSSITLTMDTYSHLTEEDEQSAANLLNDIL